MQYTLMFYLGRDEFEARTDPAKKDAFWGAFVPYARALLNAGIVVGGAGLEPPDTATTVRYEQGQRLVQDGPFAATKEQLGGVLHHRRSGPRDSSYLGCALPGWRRRRGRSAPQSTRHGVSRWTPTPA